jgi:hypothetical protein
VAFQEPHHPKLGHVLRIAGSGIHDRNVRGRD